MSTQDSPSTKREDPQRNSIHSECVRQTLKEKLSLVFSELIKRKRMHLGAGGFRSGYKGYNWYSFFLPTENKVLVARNAKFLENSLITQEASGSLEDLEIIQEEDTHPFIDTSLIMKRDDLEMHELKSDLFPFVGHKERRPKITTKLGTLVDIPPTANTVGSKWFFKRRRTEWRETVTLYKAVLWRRAYSTLGIALRKLLSSCRHYSIRILIDITTLLTMRLGKWM
ncbi:hypothetical protein Tco_0943251 [Tanacetum coccineum]